MNKRSKLLKFNTITSLMSQLVVLACGFILPRAILKAFGSEVNGLVNSIAQFLQVIVFLELGVGAVVQSALYKPLAEKDTATISKIIVSAQKFFRNIGRILLIYVLLLMVGYPFLVQNDFGWIYTALLIASISISSFAQYYFGAVDSLLLTADQRGYLQYSAQIITVILNTVACVILIKLGAGIHIVKLTTSLIYLLRPVFLRWYIKGHYQLNRKIEYDSEPIAQKWNGIAQHITAVVIDGTDNIILTIFSTLSNVSIYSVYNLVVAGERRLFTSVTNGFQALVGELWAKKELQTLHKTFGWMEWLLHIGTVFIFGCTGVLLLAFVKVYTEGITDVNYMQPLFSAFIVAANAGHCLRLPYNIMILAAGHYKQTERCYIIAAILNIGISIAMVIPFGLVGVAIGTLVAMVYQTIWMAIYVSKNLIKLPFKRFLKQIFVDILTVGLGIIATLWIDLDKVSYFSWILMALKVAGIWGIILFVVNFIFYRTQMMQLMRKIFKRKAKETVYEK